MARRPSEAGDAQARRARRHSLPRYSRPWRHRVGGDATSARASRSVSAAWPPRSGSSAVEQIGPVRLCLELGLERRAGRQPVAQQGEVARAAAPGDQPAQRAADVGHGIQRLAHRSRRIAIVVEPLRPAPAAPRSRRGRSAARTGRRRAGAGRRAVTQRSMSPSRLPATAAGRVRQISRLSRVAGVDRHMACPRDPPRRGEQERRRSSGSRRDRRASPPAAASSARPARRSRRGSRRRTGSSARARRRCCRNRPCRRGRDAGHCVRRRWSRPATAAPARPRARPVRRRPARTARSKCRRRRWPIRRPRGRPPPASWPPPNRARFPRSASPASPAGRSRARPAPSSRAPCAPRPGSRSARRWRRGGRPLISRAR